MNAIINIIKANYLGGYSIELEFGDGMRQKVNFEPFLKKSLHPEIRAYLNQDKFTQFRVEYGLRIEFPQPSLQLQRYRLGIPGLGIFHAHELAHDHWHKR